jgi:hypothetical protein
MRRSLTGPLLVLGIGCVFLWRNMHPDTQVFDLLAQYWPFVLIAWGFLRLIEVAIWHRDGVRGSFSGGEIVLVIFICLFGTGIWQAREHGARFQFGGLDIWGQQYDYPVSATASAAGIKRIVFENTHGNLKLTGGDGQDVTVTGHKEIRGSTRDEADRANGETPVEIVRQGDRLVVRTNQDRVANNRRITDDLEVMVPRGMAMESRGANGDHDIGQLDGDVEISSTHGDVRLQNLAGNARLDIGHSDLVRALDVKGRIELQGRGNDVEMENIAGQVTINGSFSGALTFKNLAKPLQFEGTKGTELSVQAVPGSINMSLGEFSGKGIVGPVRLVGRARDIKLEQFTLSAELDTDRGDIEITPGKLPLGAIQARSGNGKIELLLPEKAAFELDATSQHGDAINDFSPQIRKEVSGRSATLTGKVGDGPNLKLTANRGWISVRKEGTAASQEPDEEGPNPPTPPRPPKGPKPPKDLRDSEVKM